MKPNPKDIINIIELVDTFITTLNKRCTIYKVPKVYDLRIINTKTTLSQEDIKKGTKQKPCKQIRFTVANTKTNERITLFTLDYIIKNPTDALKAPYKRTLYREFLFNAVGTFGFNLETSIRSRSIDKKLKDPNTYAIQEHILTPEEALKAIHKN